MMAELLKVSEYQCSHQNYEDNELKVNLTYDNFFKGIFRQIEHILTIKLNNIYIYIYINCKLLIKF